MDVELEVMKRMLEEQCIYDPPRNGVREGAGYFTSLLKRRRMASRGELSIRYTRRWFAQTLANAADGQGLCF